MAKQAQIPLAAVIKPFATIPSNEVRMIYNSNSTIYQFQNYSFLTVFLYVIPSYNQETEIYFYNAKHLVIEFIRKTNSPKSYGFWPPVHQIQMD